MSKVRKSIMIVTAVVAMAAGAMAGFSFRSWQKAESEITEIKSDSFKPEVFVPTPAQHLEYEEVPFVPAELDLSKYQTTFIPSENQHSVAWVYCTRSDGSWAWGSCYAVGNYGEGAQYFVTNGHVVEPYVTEGFDLNIYFDNNVHLAPELIFYEYDANLDMAILKLPEPVDYRNPVIVRDSKTVVPGEKCTAIGYPDKSAEVDSDFNGSINNQSVNSGTISKCYVVPFGETYQTFQHDAWTSHGNSGGPLFDGNGYFIGMNTLIHNNSENVSFSIVSEEVTNILDQEGVPYTKYDDFMAAIQAQAEADLEEENARLKKENDEINEERKKEIDARNQELEAEADSNNVKAENELKSANKKAEKKFLATMEEELEEPTAERDKFRMIFFILAGVAAVCLIVALILFIIENKKIVMVGEQDDGKKNYLYCVAGVFAGQKFEITGHTMIIGRDQNTCTLVFPEDTPGISTNHCSIYFDARTKAFVLTDVGSTYGTYLSDGRKLIKSVPETILPGATFSLADKVNVFKVDRE